MIRILLPFLLFSILFPSAYSQNFKPKTIINPDAVTIARDSFGTPYIMAKTDAEVAFGLAYANSEDCFTEMQEVLYISKSMMGRWKGEKGAAFDYFVHAIGVDDLVDESFDLEMEPEYITYLEGFCQGINYYAKNHPEEVLLPKAFPIKPKDVIKAYVISFAALSGVAGKVENAYTGKYDPKPETPGSNAFALSSVKTKDNETYLCINPHFQIGGPLSFYEAHLMSDEGLNMHGALFQGGTSVFMGNNENLGWGMTYNYFDGVDVFELKMHPKKKLSYEVNGTYHKLEKRSTWLKVKVGGLVIPVKKSSYWGVYGPVIKSKNGEFYGIMAPSIRNIQAGQQFYKMNKARNFEEFKTTLECQGVSKFNIVYADKEDNIYYVSYGAIPDRNEKFDCSQNISGECGPAIWEKCFPTSELPQVTNPSCGYVFNTNNSPFLATCEGENDDPDRLPSYVDLRPGNNNRATRFLEIIDSQNTFDYKEFQDIKFDAKFSKNSTFYKSLKPLMELNERKYPEIEGLITIIKNWDLEIRPDSYGPTIFELVLLRIFKQKGYGDNVFVSGLDATEEEYVEAMKHAKDHLLKHFGSVKVPLKQIHLYVRDGKEYPTLGFPDILMANYAVPYKEGKLKLNYGDTYIHFSSFSKDGSSNNRSLLPYNTSKNISNYKSQLDLYNQQKTKAVYMTKEEILKNSFKTYHP